MEQRALFAEDIGSHVPKSAGNRSDSTDLGGGKVNLREIAIRLDGEEELMLRYRVPVAVPEGMDWVVRTDRLLDVAEDCGILYVERDGEPAWVRVEEAIQVIPERPESGSAGPSTGNGDGA